MGRSALHGPCREHGSVVLETDAALDTRGRGTRVRPSGVNPQRSPTEPSARPQGAPRQDRPPPSALPSDMAMSQLYPFPGQQSPESATAGPSHDGWIPRLLPIGTWPLRPLVLDSALAHGREGPGGV